MSYYNEYGYDASQDFRTPMEVINDYTAVDYIGIGFAVFSIIFFFLFLWLFFKGFGLLGKLLPSLFSGSGRKRPTREWGGDGLDPRRLFTQSMKSMAMENCHYRCEGTSTDESRCPYVGDDLHADHWYPHSEGGATVEENLAMLCPRCNSSKGATIPTQAQTDALQWRRAHRIGGYTSHQPIHVGSWL